MKAEREAVVLKGKRKLFTPTGKASKRSRMIGKYKANPVLSIKKDTGFASLKINSFKI